MQKKIFFVILTILAASIIWRYSTPLQNYFANIPGDIKNLASSTLPSQLETLGQQIFTPPPLKNSANQESQDANLTRAGVISFTNLARRDNGNLPGLKENSLLDHAAEAKLQDMFNKQYFEHVSPSGVGPAELAKSAGYNYVLIGENLALGNFADDKALVDAWMNSPGHRANILNVRYEEIGVAVGKGMFEGHSTWLAVQEFGKPASSCPSVDSSLKSQINDLQNQVNQINVQLTEKKQQLDSAHPQTESEYKAYNQQVAEYNNLVHIYNNQVDLLKQLTAQYNAQVSAYNACLAG